MRYKQWNVKSKEMIINLCRSTIVSIYTPTIKGVQINNAFRNQHLNLGEGWGSHCHVFFAEDPFQGPTVTFDYDWLDEAIVCNLVDEMNNSFFQLLLN